MQGTANVGDARTLGALRSVVVCGDSSPGDQSPRAVILRQELVREGLAAYDAEIGRYVVTGLGRRRLTEGDRRPGILLPFPVRAARSVHGRTRNRAEEP